MVLPMCSGENRRCPSSQSSSRANAMHPQVINRALVRAGHALEREVATQHGEVMSGHGSASVAHEEPNRVVVLGVGHLNRDGGGGTKRRYREAGQQHTVSSEVQRRKSCNDKWCLGTEAEEQQHADASPRRACRHTRRTSAAHLLAAGKSREGSGRMTRFASLQKPSCGSAAGLCSVRGSSASLGLSNSGGREAWLTPAVSMDVFKLVECRSELRRLAADPQRQWLAPAMSRAAPMNRACSDACPELSCPGRYRVPKVALAVGPPRAR